jgi:hypothetical protein
MAKDMGDFWSRHTPGSRSAGPPRRRRRRHVEITILEGRQMPSVATVTAVVSPKVLPNLASGRFVPVTVSGSIVQVNYTDLGEATVLPAPEKLAEIDAANASNPPPVAVGIVTDQFRVVEPRVRTPVSPVTNSGTFFNPSSEANPVAARGLVRHYDYSFTVYLKAKTSSIDRQYTITAAGSDGESAAQATVAVYVPTHPAPPKRRPRAGRG